jgi:hypothetical protein
MTSLIEPDPAVWSEKQFGNCDPGDERRTQRLVRYAQQMAEKPDASTPRQTEDWAGCKAVYRLFERPEVMFESVTAAHYQNTRTLPSGRYLVISDTSEIDYGYKSGRKGLGPLTAKHRRGFFLHSALVMDHEICEVPTNIVEVLEVKAPKGSAAIRWVLYTQESVATFEDCIRVVEHYEQRPVVEEYHKCLKTGLQVEGRQYETADRLEPVIGVICVQAVRLLQLRDVARQAPETPAKKLVPLEWVEVPGKITRRPRAISTVREFMRALAGPGGFPGRKSDGEPGWQTVWRGLETLILALRGYHAALKKCGYG